MRQIAFLVFPDFQLLDLSGPLTAFEVAARQPGVAVDLRVVAAKAGMVRSSSGVAVAAEAFDGLPTPPHTLVVAGGEGANDAAADRTVCAWVAATAAAGTRVASVCSGAFVLAAAGLLDGRRATTHWNRSAELQRTHPRVRVDADRIFVREGMVWTSAGITAGIDMALALIEEDFGAGVAAGAARQLVVAQRRAGGQSQFSVLQDIVPASERLQRALAFAREHLAEPLPLARLAEAAALSPRQFGRLFRAETGETPARLVERLRAEAAREQVEHGRAPIERIAARCGFGDPERMRRAFVRLFGQPPQALRRLAGAPLTSGAPPGR